MTVRTNDRAQFLADIISTAVEGGTGYWAQVSAYEWDCAPASAHAVLHPMLDDESGYEDEGHRIDIGAIARGFGVLRALVADRTNFNGAPALSTPTGEDAYLSVKYRKHLLGAYNECEAGDIDADDADIIVQLAVFGKVVYG